jgi:nicotinamide-nucleotide amidase
VSDRNPLSEVTDTLRHVTTALLQACRERKLMLATAESCTGGLLAGALTAIAGSSDVVERGFVVYSNAAKHEMLGVPMATIEDHGAVSEPVARALAEGAIARSRADIAVSITGIAGPGGGSEQKPVGLVHFATARRGAATLAHRRVFAGDRDMVRLAAVATALSLIADRLS